MTVPLTPPRTIRAADIPAKWLHDVRAIIVRDGVMLRPGLASIEAWSRRGWLLLILPHNGWEFETVADRDRVLAMLEGREPLPPLPES